ncbi:hypothetical protein JEP81_19325, partial [Proteus mirabilis]|nr:hypothetical protein [Proteus mirabilis]
SIISLPERVKSAKALSETLKNLVGLERQAYGLDDVQPNKTASQLSELMDDLSKE